MSQTRENKMGTMPVTKLLLTMSLPMVISMLIQALYNIVDSIYVSQIGEHALTAVSLAFPIQNLMIAFATGSGVGVNALLSRSLGEKNFDQANRTATNGTFLSMICTVLFMTISLFGSRLFFRAQTDISQIVDAGTQYMLICGGLCFGIFGEIIFERLLQATGRTLLTMITQGTGAIINIILDPILIFGKFGLPAMGVRGAALATVIGQIIAMLLALIFNIKYNHDIKLVLKGFRPDKKIIGFILKVGVPSIAMMSIGSIMNFFMNQILLAFTATAAAVFGVYFKLQSFIFMPIFGMNNGLVPIIAYNYGAKKPDRIIKAMKSAMIFCVSVMLVGFCLFQIIPDVLLGFFEASDQMLGIGRVALRTISYSFIFAGFCIVVGSVFQALGNGVYSLIVSVARQLFALLPFAYLLSLTGDVNKVWLSFPLAEIVSVIVSAYFLYNIYKLKIKPLYYEEYSE